MPAWDNREIAFNPSLYFPLKQCGTLAVVLFFVVCCHETT
jgi:hypothetical protein